MCLHLFIFIMCLQNLNLLHYYYKNRLYPNIYLQVAPSWYTLIPSLFFFLHAKWEGVGSDHHIKSTKMGEEEGEKGKKVLDAHQRQQ